MKTKYFIRQIVLTTLFALSISAHAEDTAVYLECNGVYDVKMRVCNDEEKYCTKPKDKFHAIFKISAGDLLQWSEDKYIWESYFWSTGDPRHISILPTEYKFGQSKWEKEFNGKINVSTGSGHELVINRESGDFSYREASKVLPLNEEKVLVDNYGYSGKCSRTQEPKPPKVQF